ncbi:carnitine dehydratase [Comamonas serinivorans]|uniref:Carnitine dehydratase n=1 Tax=Comamonas serinivorans TaxID=1082851 RepID=A0A1Y0EPJ4_9BURK|nr:CoA transferase [Comamonas serinivorans]ARU05192.1 carnitine dehydratase [Comamonas serinivorans]
MSTVQASPSALPFAGLRVLDCASFIAAPVATTVLGDFGADVIKIEPHTGDSFRELYRAPGMPESDRNYPWELMSRNKRSLALNLKTPEALAALHRLVEQADVFVTNQPLPVRRKLGITYEDLKHLNPKLIYASFTAYGETGPEADKTGFDSTVYWARTGLMDLMRASEESQPIRSLPGMGDMPSGMTLYAAIVTALYRRAMTGEGSHVDTSLLACGVWSNAWMAQAALFQVPVEYRPPRTHTVNAFGNSYRTKDGRWINLAVLNEAQSAPLLKAMERTDLAQDPRFATPELRRQNHLALIPILDEVFIQHDLKEWRRRLDAAGITYGVIGVVEDMHDDEQMRIAGAIVPLGDEETIGSPFHLEGVAKRPAGPAPTLGQHTDDVLADYGFNADEIAKLRAAGALG